MGRTWESSGGEEKRAFVRTLSAELVFNLDTRRIVSFKLKPWAEAFLQLRVSLEGFYRHQRASSEARTGVQEVCTPLPPGTSIPSMPPVAQVVPLSRVHLNPMQFQYNT